MTQTPFELAATITIGMGLLLDRNTPQDDALHDQLRDDYSDVFAVLDGDQDAPVACLADCPDLTQRACELVSRFPIAPDFIDADPTMTDADKARAYDLLFEYTGEDDQ